MARYIDQLGVVWPVICRAEMVTGRYRALGLQPEPPPPIQMTVRVASQNLSCKSA